MVIRTWVGVKREAGSAAVALAVEMAARAVRLADREKTEGGREVDLVGVSEAVVEAPQEEAEAVLLLEPHRTSLARPRWLSRLRVPTLH